MTLRKIIFWLHLLAGIIAGVSIAVMCFTGTALAFEKELIAYAERDVRRIAMPTVESPRLSIDELLSRVRTAHPAAKISEIALENRPFAAVAFNAGRNEIFYANPFTGEIRQITSTGTRDFLRIMEDWHRQLALSGPNRPMGKAINGACNIAFFFLTTSGLYLWWPRKWRTKGLKRSLWFVPATNAKARDWNWHNVIGLWSAPVLIVLTITALPISYRWASNLIFTLSGTPPPTRSSATTAPMSKLPAPVDQARALSAEILIAHAQKELPAWTSLTYRTGNTSEGPGPATVALRTANAWPRTALTTFSIDPFTGEILNTSSYASLNTAQRVRSWTRFLHTGEAVGAIGQAIAALASLGGCVLVYTGFALAWHRWRRWRNSPPLSIS